MARPSKAAPRGFIGRSALLRHGWSAWSVDLLLGPADIVIPLGRPPWASPSYFGALRFYRIVRVAGIERRRSDWRRRRRKVRP
jgi:hypothetical protein